MKTKYKKKHIPKILKHLGKLKELTVNGVDYETACKIRELEQHFIRRINYPNTGEGKFVNGQKNPFYEAKSNQSNFEKHIKGKRA